MADRRSIDVQLGTAEAAVVQDVAAIMQGVGEIVQVLAQISITDGSISSKGHIASLPGQPPNNDTGFLANNIEVTQPEPLHVRVSSNAPYSAALEYGSSKMAARPFMAPAIGEATPEIQKVVAAAVSASLRKHFGGK